MDLPPFPKKRPVGRIKGLKVNREEREGKITFDHSKGKFCIEKGDKILGYYDTMTEAYYMKKKLIYKKD